ncbi:MAG: tetratricopeptide repeat protein [Bacteroidales bacterium]|nr:tetratricopeptide repeat protein [Bacteroidales bacterium]MBN2749342.1 tetratricopeptide repeat protein [Bacteroidales bacterium]
MQNIRCKLWFFLLIVPLFLNAETVFANKVDSLKNVLSSVRDAQKITVLLELSLELQGDEQGLNYATDAYKLAQKYSKANSEADALFHMGRYYTKNWDDSLALSLYQHSLEISQKANYSNGIARALCHIGKAYGYLGDSQQARENLTSSLGRSREFGIKPLEAEILLELGILEKDCSNSEQALTYLFQALEQYQLLGITNSVAYVYEKIGQTYFQVSDYSNAAEYFKKNIEASQSIGDSYGTAIACINLGVTYIKLSSLDLALTQYQRALGILEKGNDKEQIASAKVGIAQIYESMPRNPLATSENEVNYRKALDYYMQSLALFKEIRAERKKESDNLGIARILNNIAIIYSRIATNNFIASYGEAWEDSLVKLSSSQILTSFNQSVDYYNQALAIFAELDERSDIASVKTNLGTTYSYAREWRKADEHLTEALQLVRQIGNTYELATTVYALGDSRFRQGRYDRAEELMLECVKLAKSVGLKEVEQSGCETLSKVYVVKNDYVRAFLYQHRATRIKDEVFTEKSQKLITEMQTKYETEKKEQEIELLNRDKALQDSVIQRQQLVIAGAVVGAMLILLVALLMFRMFREKQRANRALEEKNALITHQKKEITDSIRYAGRIQNAILPSPELIKENLPEHFVLFLPRDIVSGDFFWITRRGSKVVVVAADCTGHGVPGAFMSMLGVSFLYEIVNKEGILQPAEILNYLRERVKTTLSQKGKADEQKDGMDISLCVIDHEAMIMEWSGAYNPLYLIRGGALNEFKADKMPIAIHINDHLPFTNHCIPIEKGDVFYIFSDGYADQFGGADAKKFMTKRLKELLLEIWDKPMPEQKEILYQTHLNWRGDHEQIDDIIVFGISI